MLKVLDKWNRMSADYGTRNPSYAHHTGIDYTNNDVDSKVLSLGYGRVYKIVNDVLDSQHGMTEGKDFPVGRWGGNFIEIDMGGGLYTRFKHLKQNSMLVKVGDYVVPGQPIAVMGNTGQSTGMHLHVQVAPGTDYGAHIDPLPYINEEKHFVGIKAPTPAPTPEPTSDTVHEVVKGDSLWALAQRYLGNGKRYTEIKEWNGLTSDVINVGQKLIVVKGVVTPVVPTSKEVYHVVVKGDSLWALAEKYLGSGKRYTEIKEWNKLTSDIINVGQNLLVKK